MIEQIMTKILKISYSIYNTVFKQHREEIERNYWNMANPSKYQNFELKCGCGEIGHRIELKIWDNRNDPTKKLVLMELPFAYYREEKSFWKRLKRVFFGKLVADIDCYIPTSKAMEKNRVRIIEEISYICGPIIGMKLEKINGKDCLFLGNVEFSRQDIKTRLQYLFDGYIHERIQFLYFKENEKLELGDEILNMLEHSMENFKKDNVSKPIDLSEFSDVEDD